MIWNKSLTVHTLVYDMSRNILYEDGDVDVRLLGGEGMEEFLADARGKVQKKAHKSKTHETAVKKSQSGGQLALGGGFAVDEDDDDCCSLCGMCEQDYFGGHYGNFEFNKIL